MIVVTGEALVDLVIDPDGHVSAALGGAPFNTARTCGRLGADVAFLGAISTDRFGTLLTARLDADRVRTDHLVRLDLPTTLAAAELNETGAATYRFYIQGTAAPGLATIPPDLEPDVLFAGGLGLVFEPMAETVETLVSECAGDALVMVDVNCRPLIVPDRESYVARVERVLRHASVVKVSDEDVHYLFPGADPVAAAQRILGLGPTAVLMTAGGAGVTALTANGSVTVPAEPVEVVDTIGAGDSFGGGFLSWWVASGLGVADLADLSLVEAAARAGNRVAGVVCTRHGADPPWRDELGPDWASTG